jgi:hypothetical protein
MSPRIRILIIAVLAACSPRVAGSTTWGWFVISPWTPKGQTNLMFDVVALLDCSCWRSAPYCCQCITASCGCIVVPG